MPAPFFIDAAGRRWELSIDDAAAVRVQEQCGISLRSLFPNRRGEFPVLTKLFGDAPSLVGVVWAIVEPAALKADITPEDFGRCCALEAMAEAFLRSLANYVPDRDARRLMHEIISQAKPKRKAVAHGGSERFGD